MNSRQDVVPRRKQPRYEMAQGSLATEIRHELWNLERLSFIKSSSLRINMWTGFSWLVIRDSSGLCEHGSEPSDSLKSRTFRDQLSHYHLLY